MTDTDTNEIQALADDMAELRRSVPATLKILQMTLEDVFETPAYEIDTERHIARLAGVMDVTARILLAHALRDPAKVSPAMIKVALEAARMSVNALHRRHDIRWKNQMYNANYYENTGFSERKEG
ncbi:MAG TPA: hypothetical protein DEA55_11250 [Rhodospirillaceae bacterium]|nr:hypothetical protein [Rhodospirillaceae bacterium]